MPKAPPAALILSLSLLGPVGPAAADERLSTTTVTASVQVGARAAVQISTDVLVFHIIDAAIPAEARVIFTAGARTRADGEVRLFVSRELSDSLTMTASDGTMQALTSNEPVMVSRWTGGGRRRGEIRFQLSGAPGTYRVAVRFFITAP
jgi:hypothetical protein